MWRICLVLVLWGCSRLFAETLSPEVREFVKVDAPIIALEHVRVIDGTDAAAKEDFSAIIHWGDNSQSVGTILPNNNGGFDVLGGHTYDHAGWHWLPDSDSNSWSAQRCPNGDILYDVRPPGTAPPPTPTPNPAGYGRGIAADRLLRRSSRTGIARPMPDIAANQGFECGAAGLIHWSGQDGGDCQLSVARAGSPQRCCRPRPFPA